MSELLVRYRVTAGRVTVLDVVIDRIGHVCQSIKLLGVNCPRFSIGWGAWPNGKCTSIMGIPVGWLPDRACLWVQREAQS